MISVVVSPVLFNLSAAMMWRRSIRDVPYGHQYDKFEFALRRCRLWIKAIEQKKEKMSFLFRVINVQY